MRKANSLLSQVKARRNEPDGRRSGSKLAPPVHAGLYKSTYLVRAVTVALERRGVLPATLLEGTALEGAGLEDGLARVSLEDWQTLTRRAVSLSDDSGLGLDIGGSASDHVQQIVGQLVLACRSLRDAMRTLQRYHALLGNTVEFDLVEEGHLAYFVCTSLRPDPMAPEFDIEMILSWVYRTSRRFAWRDGSDAKEVWLAYPAPPHAARYRNVFPCPVRFNRRQNAILFSRASLDKTQPYADWRMLDVLSTAAEQMLLEYRSPSLSDQVRALLRGETDLRAIDSSRIARMMRLTPRAFRRKLIAANTPWSAILDDTRRRIACDELRRNEPISAIADRLGFAEPSAFSRAFKRWTGVTPARYSKAMAGR